MKTIERDVAESAARADTIRRGDLLGEKVRPLQIDPHQFLEGRLGRVEQVRTLARRTAGVVDQRLNPARLSVDATPGVARVPQRRRCQPGSTERVPLNEAITSLTADSGR